MIVVFDTNVWKNSLYLKSSAAAAVRFYIHQHRARVGLPEVVRLEVERHLRIDILASRKKIRAEHDRLLGLFDTLKEVVLPTDEEVEALVLKTFSQPGFDLLEVPFGERSARASFLRTIDKIRPSHGSQQFKDGVIWEDCKQLAESDEVVFVTSDLAFYEDDNLKKGLARVLAEEAEHCKHPLRVLPSLSDLMGKLRIPITIEDRDLAEAVFNEFREHVDRLLSHTGFVCGPEWTLHKSMFATENPDTLYLEFGLDSGCEDETSEGRTDVTLRIEGDGLLHVGSRAFSNLRPREMSISFSTPEGARERRASMFASAHVVLGHRSVTNVVRERLDL